MAGAAALARPLDDAEFLRWESLACALDEVGKLPYAWGVVSGLRRLPELRGILFPSESATLGGATYAVAEWSARAVADAFFVPIDDCAPLATRGDLRSLLTASSSGGADARGEALTCARGTSLMAFIVFVERFPLGLGIDSAVAAAAAVASGALSQLPLCALKAGLAASDPGEGALAWFLTIHADSAWAWVEGRARNLLSGFATEAV